MSVETKATNLADFSDSITKLVESFSPSLVEIRGRRRGFASGFIWRSGLVVTAEEALGHHTAVTLAIGTQHFEATVIGRDPSTDIAVLKAAGLSAPALTLTTDVTPRTGEIAIVVGRREQGVSARLGIVSLSGPAWRSMRGGQIDSLIRLDVTLDRGSEGGAVIDSVGRVIGMAVRGPRRSALVIPAATIERIASRILEKGSVRPGYLGLGLHPIRIRGHGDEKNSALIVLGVADGGPGQGAGVLQGDIITAWNGESLTGLRDIWRRLGPDSEGQTVELSLLRAGEKASARCVIGARPQG